MVNGCETKHELSFLLFIKPLSPVNKGRKKANVGTNSNKAGFFPDVRS